MAVARQKLFEIFQISKRDRQRCSSLNAIDPLFSNLALPDLHLQTTSPAVNAGAGLTGIGSTDIDGKARVLGAGIDLGADEAR